MYNGTGHKVRDMRGGFTLSEVMVASAVVVVLALTFFEAVIFLNRMAYDVKSRLAADAVAFDTAWRTFNRPLSWFEKEGSEFVGGLTTITPLDRSVSDAWGDRSSQVLVRQMVLPQGVPATNWVITVNVEWPRASAGAGTARVETFREPYTISRMRTNRRVFR